MMVSGRRFRSIGWLALLLVCVALVMVLAFRVNALRSQVHRTELQIVSLRKEKLYLETEVETRANQQQLKLWNDVEFGYTAPTASQYLSSERQLAAYAKPDEPGAPEPIRVASIDDTVAAQAMFPSIASRLAGDPQISAPADDERATAASSSAADRASANASLGARLATVGPMKPAFAKKAAEKDTSAKSGKATLAPSSAARSRDDDGETRPAKSAAPKSAAPKSAASRPGKTTKPTKPGKTAA